MTLGQRLKGWRDAKGLSQGAAAQLAGVKQPAWSEYETDGKLPRADVIENLIALTADDEKHAVTLEMFAQAERDRRVTATGTG